MDIEGEILRLGLLRLGRFRLSSGELSPVYVDLRPAASYPDFFRSLVDRLSALVSEGGHDAVCGVAVSGIPLATGVALRLQKPLLYVRERRKDHGTMSALEGEVGSGVDVAVIDDVSTTGSLILRAVEALRSSGARVRRAYVVVDREQGARERLAGQGVGLEALTTLRSVVEKGEELGLVDGATAAEIRRHLAARVGGGGG